MTNTSIIEVTDNDWSKIVNQCCNYDFYHTQAYHLVETQDSSDRAILFVFSLDKDFIAFPLIVREIENTNYKDCTSVYGYCGPISNLRSDKLEDDLIDGFQSSLFKFFEDQNIIAAFTRLHPLIASDDFLRNIGEINDINKTVAIDLKLPVDEQRKQFRKSNKSEINQLRGKKGYSVRIAICDEDVERFVQIYNENMRRVNASDYYYFDLSYFNNILKNPNYDARLLLAVKDDIVTAGSIFTISNKIMQYHLAGTDVSYMSDTPMKLILDEARLMGSELGLEYLHLGGGVGGSDEDSLFRFKSGFSHLKCQYRTWQLIVNNEAYFSLVEANKSPKESNYFPLYRAN